ncbi:MAG: hypothetical protein UU16_C0009G0019 [Candidatus Woesebacteria bacterium GW2011_GWA2_40_7]|uniref:Bro-N domain-containing protein n=1 Tax=Candidatus Woesebacteria bacterium GW2011_GWA2_40_7 TaxID=1618562 RepID=A0A0G0TAE9_9BACT|nr:MAG: hypothetical protein UU16_C0009G0019 [Candidatus Woesebacteria bacterium GW2011_GWA2_40_7]
MTVEKDTKISIFKGKNIRKTIYKNEWWFSVVDVCLALTESVDSGAYWRKLKQRLTIEGSQVVTFCHGLKLLAPDGKLRETDCANTETIFRIIQTIPSPKVEPMKRWLAKVGYERIQEIEDPELATKRTRFLYKAKGYSDGWIEKRMRGIAIREELTDEWQNRGAKAKKDYDIKRQNLRDHMDDFELIFTMLGERSTTEIHRQENTQGMPKLKTDAGRGGRVAGIARRELEKEIGRTVVTKGNFLTKKLKQQS